MPQCTSISRIDNGVNCVMVIRVYIYNLSDTTVFTCNLYVTFSSADITQILSYLNLLQDESRLPLKFLHCNVFYKCKIRTDYAKNTFYKVIIQMVNENGVHGH